LLQESPNGRRTLQDIAQKRRAENQKHQGIK
jgi:hypothetical protein